ncbi:transglycosylase domain-containing protein [Cochlodiniinecator piscidefendens]|uniref:transglycosylase domain-containing protein n=1 Tax=Cochlodiniinecator piscidefendens TaxID=2715756 RepID=UPI00140934C0|nr:transglycosylase domain-containing protein [Cochlodiniinecator piscidefendens]
MSGTGRKKPTLVADKRYSKPTVAKKTSQGAAKKPTPKRKPARKKDAPKRHWLIASILRIFRFIWRIIWGVMWRGIAVVSLLLACGIGYYYFTLPDSPSALVDGRARGSVTLLDREGQVFAWRGDQFGGMITTDTVSPYLHDAVVATEDKRFYSHFGISPRGIASAIRINLREGRGPLSGHGGSTITQQTAKLLCLGNPYDPSAGQTEAEYEAECRQGSLWRKITEMTYSMAMELRYTKEEILSIYLNRAFLGSGARGFEAASQRYFGISANEVSPAQAAMLAGLLVAPTRYAPTNNLQRSRDRAQIVLNLMRDQGYITAAQAQDARDNPASLSTAAAARAGGYFADWVMSSGPDFFTRDTTEDVIIRTTLDQRLQTAAEEAMLEVFSTRVREGSEAQAAIVVMSSDGAVRAMVGGRQTRVTGAFNRATMASRQTGSSFKPFVYAAALDLGYTYNDYVEDAPLTINIPGSGPWSPANYDHQFHGMVTMTDALRRSLNIPAVKISESVGRDNVRTVAEQFGIESNLADGPALALGASESTLLEMTGAYAGILNGGSSVTPFGLVELSLQGDDTPLMQQQSGIGERVISRQAAEQLIYMMNQVVESGSGTRAQLPGREVAGKTGTTQAARDAWFIGFTADYVAGVWMGYDDNTPLTGVTGGGLPATIWQETMLRVHEGLPAQPLPMIVPEPPQPIVPETPEPQPNTQNRRNQTDNLIENMLRNLLGGNRNR